MSIEINCLRCHKPMEEGFLIELLDQQRARWCQGRPNPSIWGEKRKVLRLSLRVLTYRCPNCGYLESYAPASEKNA